MVLQYASARVGAILVNVDPGVPDPELQYALQQSGVSVLMLAASFPGSDYTQMLGDIRDTCPELREVLVIDKDWDRLLLDGDRVPGADLEARESTLEFDDPINIQYTSGKTGAPKGATLSHHNVLNNGFLTGQQMGLTEYDRLCAPVPCITALAVLPPCWVA